MQKGFRGSRHQECGSLLGKAIGLSRACGGLPAGGLCCRVLGWPPAGLCPSWTESIRWMGMEPSCSVSTHGRHFLILLSFQKNPKTC